MMWHTTALPEPDGEDAASLSPAFVIDVATGGLVAANAAARRAWGLAADTCTAVALDRAMPALPRLLPASRNPDGETLTFWTPRGLLQLRCHVESIVSEPGRFLVRGLQRGDGAALHAADGCERRSGLGAQGVVDAPTLARLAHEIRTPLSAAIAYAEVLKEEHFGPLGNGRYREYAHNIFDCARHALSVVDGMLASDPGGTGLPELAFRDLDPARVIDNCVAVARPLAERAGLDLIASLPSGTPRVIADEVSLKQMLLNLITNAIKFARPGDRITLAAAYSLDGGLHIEVADNGPGMEAPAPPLPPSVLPEGSAGGAGGLGIGLPLTRALAEANGAALIVDSEPGRGTRATIAFGKDRVVPV
jgi:two-component system cell cycle sensor histidine kinase PleC